MLRVEAQEGCPLFRRGDRMSVRLPEVDTTAGTICVHALAQALPFLTAAERAKVDVETVLPRLRCISGGAHFAEFSLATSYNFEEVESRIERALRRVSAFAPLARRDLARIVACLHTDQYFPRTLLAESGVPADRLVLITKGIAELVVIQPGTPERPLGRFGEGEVFGGDEFVRGAPHTTTLRCLTIVQAAVLLRRDLLALAPSIPELARFVPDVTA